MQPLVPNLHGIYTMQKKISANRFMQTHAGKVVASHNLYMYKDIRCVLKSANKVFAPYSPGCARVSKSTNTFLLRTIYLYIYIRLKASAKDLYVRLVPCVYILYIKHLYEYDECNFCLSPFKPF